MESETIQKALRLIQEIARTPAEPNRWARVLSLLSSDLGGAAIGLSLEIPNIADSPLSYRHNLDPANNVHTARTIAKNQSPWIMEGLTHGFVRTRPTNPAVEVAETEYYRVCLVPQGVAAELPVAHVFGHQDGRDLAAIIIYRMAEGRPFTDEDLAMLNLLVPHMAIAYQLHEELRGHRQRRNALAAVVDRFAHGVVMLDDAGRVVTANRAGDRILAAGDGLSRLDGRVRAADPGSNKRLQAQISRVVGSERMAGGPRSRREEPVAIERTSGARAYTAVVWKFAQPEPGVADAVAAGLFIADPEEHNLPMLSVLRSLYRLTEAEADLVALLCDGHSMESAAAARSVTIQTARGQLKSIFSKTGTKRQGDLIAHALTGLSALEPRDEEPQ